METKVEMPESVTKSKGVGTIFPSSLMNRSVQFLFNDWSTYFKIFFKPIPHLTTNHNLGYKCTCTFHINCFIY